MESFREALTRIPWTERDAWVDRTFGLDGLPDDGPDLPRGCTPYLPSPVNTVLQMIEVAKIGARDVFVDVGSGIGRATTLVHLLTGASAIGLEIQPELVRTARNLAARLELPRVSTIEGDAVRLTRDMTTGSVFFLYCPFSGDRLHRVMDHLASMAQTRPIRVCSVDLPLPVRPWLVPVSESGSLAVYESVAATSP